MHLQENTLFDLDLKVTQNVTEYPLNHVTYAPAKFEFSTTNGLGSSIYKKMHYLILTYGSGHVKCCPEPSTSCDLCTCKV